IARLASTSSEDGITWPLPVIGVVMASLLLAVAAGMCTTGALPNAPETVTAEFGSAEPEEPQPTRARPASRGTTSAAEIRRMRILSVGDLAGALGRSGAGRRPGEPRGQSGVQQRQPTRHGRPRDPDEVSGGARSAGSCSTPGPRTGPRKRPARAGRR